MSRLNLEEQYKLLNSEIFGNVLPQDITIRWNNSRITMGKTYIRSNNHGEMHFKITISRFFLCTDHQYIETLIHEMIHVFMAVKGEFKIDSRVHGPHFRKHMERINRDFPRYNITVKEDRPIPVDRDRMPQQKGYLACFGNNIYFNLYYRPIDAKMQQTIIKRLPALYGIDRGDIYFFSGKFERLSTAPVRRNVRTLIGKIQYLKDRSEMEEILAEVKREHMGHYPLTKKDFVKSLLLSSLPL